MPDSKHDHQTLKFPEKFLWGAATSAFQVEGNNTHSDWWAWETTRQSESHRSGLAADQYNRFEEDFKLAKDLGHNAHRLSVEWSRIEPKPGEFDQNEIEHYKTVLKSLKDKGLTVMLTLHHFSNPIWFAKKGGWTSMFAPYYFNRFVKRIAPELKEYVDLWITLNEPGGYAYDAYGRGKFPPNLKGKWSFLKAFWNLSQAHRKAYKTIHKLVPNSKVGVSHNVTSFNAFHKHNLIENLYVWIADLLFNHSLYFLTGKKTHDFLGLNYYYHRNISLNGESSLPSLIDVSVTKKDVSDMGWEIRPEGLFDVLMDFSDYHLPIYITENGIASNNDDRKVRFLLTYLKEVYHAISAGLDVKGYFYWSLLDNYEWVEGFEPQFGLVEVDFKTQERKVRPSGHVYEEIIQNNGIPHYLLKLLGHGNEVKDVLENPHDLSLWTICPLPCQPTC